MLRVRLFPGFSTAVLQTGPLTLGVRINITFWNPVNKLSATCFADYFACMRTGGFVNNLPIVFLMNA